MEQLTVRAFHHHLSSSRPVRPANAKLVVQHVEGRPWRACCHPRCARGKCCLWTLRTSFCRVLPPYTGLSLSDSLWVTNYKRPLFAGDQCWLCSCCIPWSCLYLSPRPTNNNNNRGSREPVSALARLQRWDLLNRAVQEKMAAVSRSAVHICQIVTVQEKMRSRACSSFNAQAACAVCHFSYIFVIVISATGFQCRFHMHYIYIHVSVYVVNSKRLNLQLINGSDCLKWQWKAAALYLLVPRMNLAPVRCSQRADGAHSLLPKQLSVSVQLAKLTSLI